MKQKLVYMVLLLGMAMGLASCDDYLNIEPKGKRIPKSLADYEAFLRYEYGTHRMPVLQTCYLLNDEYLTNSYASYYPMIALVVFFYFFCRYAEFERASFVILAAFFIYYVVFIFVPVAGPTFYYKAVGLSNITQGVFPALGDYFNTHTDCLPTPGYTNGFFYELVEDAKAAGERPTAAFPSSHVGIATVCMLLAAHTRQRKLVWLMLPFYVFLCMSTVYIQAHYVIDALAGFVSALAIYLTLMAATKNIKN